LSHVADLVAELKEGFFELNDHSNPSVSQFTSSLKGFAHAFQVTQYLQYFFLMTLFGCMFEYHFCTYANAVSHDFVQLFGNCLELFAEFLGSFNNRQGRFEERDNVLGDDFVLQPFVDGLALSVQVDAHGVDVRAQFFDSK
jgi:hypothetical protein